MRDSRGLTRAGGRGGVCASPYFKTFLVTSVAYGFIALAVYSQSVREHGYSVEDRQAMANLVASSNGAKKTYDSKEKRKVTMELWNISEYDLTRPVNLWGENAL